MFQNIIQGYFSGGAGYVLSEEALRRFAAGVDDEMICDQDDVGDEDRNLGVCMHNLNVTFGDSRDELSQKRFLVFPPEHHIVPSEITN